MESKIYAKMAMVLAVLLLGVIFACGGAGDSENSEREGSGSGWQLTPILPTDSILIGDGGDTTTLLGLTLSVKVPFCGFAMRVCGDFCLQDEMREFYEDFIDGILVDPIDAFPKCRLYLCRDRATEFPASLIPWDRTTMNCQFYDSEPGSRCQLEIEGRDEDVFCEAEPFPK